MICALYQKLRLLLIYTRLTAVIIRYEDVTKNKNTRDHFCIDKRERGFHVHGVYPTQYQG